jgi:hypothetical protein
MHKAAMTDPNAGPSAAPKVGPAAFPGDFGAREGAAIGALTVRSATGDGFLINNYDEQRNAVSKMQR